MQYLNAEQRKIDQKEFRNRSAVETDCTTLIQESTTVMVGGRVVIVYISDVRDIRVDRIAAVIKRVKCVKDIRTSGLVTTSRIFGFAPRNELRRHACRAVSLAHEMPTVHSIIAEGSEAVANLYLETMPDMYKQHKEQIGKLKREYLLGDSLFTSGIVNRNNPLRYHFDSGNFDNCCSAMLGFKTNIEGGRLCVPELDVKLEVGHKSLTLFDGQGLLHGVTPIIKKKKNAMRFTVVYYSLRQMWNCEEPTDELERGRAMRAKIEMDARNGSVRNKNSFPKGS